VTRGVRKETHEMKNGWTGLLNGMDYWNAKWTNMFYSFVNQAEPKEKDDYEPFELEDSITLDINALLKPSVFEENDDYWILPDDDLVVEDDEPPKIEERRIIGRKRKSVMLDKMTLEPEEPEAKKETPLMITCVTCGDSFPFHEFTHCKTL